MKRTVLLILALLILCGSAFAGGRNSRSGSSSRSNSRSGSSAPTYAPDSDFSVSLGTDNRTALITDYLGKGGAVNIPETIQGMPVVQISDGAFRGTRVGEVVIPEGVTTIGANAFADCGRLTRVTMPATVRTIGNGAFTGCRELLEVSIADGARITWGTNVFTGDAKLLLGTQASLRTLGYTGNF